MYMYKFELFKNVPKLTCKITVIIIIVIIIKVNGT